MKENHKLPQQNPYSQALDQSLLVEELAYWTHVSNSDNFDPELKKYALNQIKQLQLDLNECKSISQLRRLT